MQMQVFVVRLSFSLNGWLHNIYNYVLSVAVCHKINRTFLIDAFNINMYIK